MEEVALITVGLVFSVLGAIVIGGMPFHYRRELKKARTLAEQQFRNYSSGNQAHLLGLKGSSAQILDKSESYTAHNGRVHDYVLTLFVVTPEGQHFLFKSSESTTPYVSALSSDRARLVLKDKFRSAAASEA